MDGRTIGRWPLGRPWLGRIVVSVMKLHGGKTLASVRKRAASARTGRVRADASCVHADTARPRGRTQRPRECICSLPRLASPRLPSPPLPSPPPSPTDADVDAQNFFIIIIKLFIYIIYLFIYFGSCCQLEKRKKKFRFSVFNPQDPRDPRVAWAKPWEEGFFGLVPLVTHPSSIPFLGGLTPKFLSLSLHYL
jgi:hypothetical protein